VDPGESHLPPAGRRPAVQKWHDEKGTSSGMFRPEESADRRRNWVPASDQPTMQKWHGSKNTDSKDKSKTSQRQWCTKNSDRMDVQDETPERPGMQYGNKGSLNKTAPASSVREDNRGV
jgi:hypothetical protein